MVRGVGFRAVFNVALLVPIEDIGSGAEGREDFGQLVVLVGLVEAGCDLVHGWHWAPRCHIDPESRQETQDSAFQIVWVHHDIHFVPRVPWIDSVCESAVIVVPFEH